MSPEERKLMEDVLDEEAKMVEQETAVIKERAKRTGKELCKISCQTGFFFAVGLLMSVFLGTFFPIFGLVLADAVNALNDLAYFQSVNDTALANENED